MLTLPLHILCANIIYFAPHVVLYCKSAIMTQRARQHSRYRYGTVLSVRYSVLYVPVCTSTDTTSKTKRRVRLGMRDSFQSRIFFALPPVTASGGSYWQQGESISVENKDCNFMQSLPPCARQILTLLELSWRRTIQMIERTLRLPADPRCNFDKLDDLLGILSHRVKLASLPIERALTRATSQPCENRMT